MLNMLLFVSVLLQAFNTLYRGFTNSRQLNQFYSNAQLSLLHAANQPVVPEATPVPGYERSALPQMTTQDIESG